MLKTEWGNATWYLLHTLCYKFRTLEEKYIKELYNQLVKISINLPCPDCSNHALLYIKQINTVPKTYNELNVFFWGMHNWVNHRLNKPQYTSKAYMEKYNLACTKNVIKNYIIIAKKNGRYDKAMLSTFNRSIIVNDFIKYINNNIHRFNV